MLECREAIQPEQTGKLVPAILALVFSASPLYAAGPQDCGTVGVTLTIEDRVQLSGESHIEIQQQGADGRLSGQGALCIYRRSSDHYSVTVESDSSSGFLMQTSDGEQIPYRVNWSGVAVEPGQNSGLLGGAHRTASCCDGGQNVFLEIETDEPAEHPAHSRLMIMVTAE